jgi:metallo-beta-lactamase class B
MEPFRIVGNVYYVGASDITSFLITSREGHILLDGGFAETASMILANIVKLGFNPRDVKILLNSQAHFDHAGGLAELKRKTGGRMIASKEDGSVLSRGGKGDFYFRDTMTFEPILIDETIEDRKPLKLGETTITPVLTPGHTKGCTTWTAKVVEDGKQFSVAFLCGLTVLPNTKFVNNEAYPNIAVDFARSHRILKELPCDVFLGAHGSYFDLEGKRNRWKASPESNPFVNPEDLRKHVQQKESEFKKLLEKHS